MLSFNWAFISATSARTRKLFRVDRRWNNLIQTMTTGMMMSETRPSRTSKKNMAIKTPIIMTTLWNTRARTPK